MMLAVVLLVVIILNLVVMSVLAFLGKKNWFLFSAIVEAVLSLAFSALVTSYF